MTLFFVAVFLPGVGCALSDEDAASRPNVGKFRSLMISAKDKIRAVGGKISRVFKRGSSKVEESSVSVANVSASKISSTASSVANISENPANHGMTTLRSTQGPKAMPTPQEVRASVMAWKSKHMATHSQTQEDLGKGFDSLKTAQSEGAQSTLKLPEMKTAEAAKDGAGAAGRTTTATTERMTEGQSSGGSDPWEAISNPDLEEEEDFLGPTLLTPLLQGIVDILTDHDPSNTGHTVARVVDAAELAKDVVTLWGIGSVVSLVDADANLGERQKMANVLMARIFGIDNVQELIGFMTTHTLAAGTKIGLRLSPVHMLKDLGDTLIDMTQVQVHKMLGLDVATADPESIMASLKVSMAISEEFERVYGDAIDVLTSAEKTAFMESLASKIAPAVRRQMLKETMDESSLSQLDRAMGQRYRTLEMPANPEAPLPVPVG